MSQNPYGSADPYGAQDPYGQQPAAPQAPDSYPGQDAYPTPAPVYGEQAPAYGAPAYPAQAPAYGAPAYPQAAYGAPGYGAPASTSKNNLAGWSLGTGIAGLFCCPVVLSIVAIVLGRQALAAADQGLATNRTMATWGFWLGVVGAALGVVMAVVRLTALVSSLSY